MSIERYAADQALVSWKQESSFGSKPSSVDRFMSANSVTVDTSVGVTEITSLDGTRQPQTTLYGTEESGGTIPGNLRDGRIFMTLLGDPSTSASGESNNSNKHEYLSRHDPLSFTVQVDMKATGGLPDLNRHIVGCVGTRLSITAEPDEGVTYELEYEAQDDTVVSDGDVDSVESFSGGRPFNFDEVSFEVDGSTRDDIQDATVDIETNTERFPTIRGTDAHLAKAILPGGLTLSVDLTVLFKDTFWRDKLKNRNSISNFKMDMTRSDNDDHIIVELKNLKIEDAPYNVPEDGQLEDSVTLVADTIEVTVHDNLTH